MTIKVTYNVTDVYMTQSVSPVYINVSYSDGSGGAAVWGGITGTLSNQTDLQTALNLKLDESTIDGGTEGQILSKASATDFDFAWINNYAKYLATNVRNQSGSTIAAFQVVYISGATGNKPLISLADADTEATSSKTYGVTAVSIANNGTGDVVTAGELSGIDTSAFTEGDSLWLSTTAGGVVTSPPAEPAHSVFIGTVVRSHPTLGVIDVAIANGYELNELHGVLITSAANNQGLFYTSSTGLWENKSIATALGYTPEQPLTFNSPLSRVGNVVSITQATGSVNGFLSATDWTTFNSKQNALGYTPANAATTLTINGVTYDLSANRSWTISAGISGTIATGQVAYGTAANTIGGSNNLFWDAANGRLGIGTNAPISRLETFQNSIYVAGAFSMYSNTASDEALFYFRRGRGTLASPLIVQSGDVLGSLRFAAQFNSTVGGYNTNSKIDSVAETNGADLRFYTNNSGYSLSPTEKLRITGSGNLLLGTTTDDGTNRLQVSGSVAFGGSTGLKWDDTNKRLGIGTNAPAYKLEISSSGSLAEGVLIKNTGTLSNSYASLNLINNIGYLAQIQLTSSNFTQNPLIAQNGLSFYNGGTGGITIWAGHSSGVIKFQTGSSGTIGSEKMTLFSTGNLGINNPTDDGVNRLQVSGNALIKGSGNTSATTALTVLNSSSTSLLTVRNDSRISIGTNTFVTDAKVSILDDIDSPSGTAIGLRITGTGASTSKWRGRIVAGGNTIAFLMGEYNSQAWLGGHNAALNAWAPLYINPDGTSDLYLGDSGGATVSPVAIVTIKNSSGNTLIGGNTDISSAILNVDSTTKGLLPPRMTTTQKNAIASPAAGLVVYDTTLAKLCVYTTAWETITSV